MKKEFLGKLLKNNFLIWLIVVFILADLIFNWQIFFELFNKNGFRVFKTDPEILEYFAENYRKAILAFNNPFQINDNLLFPFGASSATSDLGLIHGLYFLILRPFLSVHKSMMLAILISLFLAEVCMYLLLRFLKVSRIVSIILAISFMAAPFMTFPRITQHYTYLHHFLYPLNVWLLLKLFEEEKIRKLIKLSIFSGLSLALLFYTNLYFFVMFGMMILVFGMGYYFISNKKELINIIKKKLEYLFISGVVLIFCSLPQVMEIVKFNSLGDSSSNQELKTTALLSGNLFSVFLPSPYSFVFGNLVKNHLSNFQPLEGVTYLGILGFIGIFIYLNKYRKEKTLGLIFTSGLFFYFLSVGPFLKFSNSISNIPFLYYLLAKIPILNFIANLRAPTRFAVPMSFLFLILSALVIDRFLIKNKKKKIYIVLLFVILLIDQLYYIPKKDQAYDIRFPLKTYDYIKKKKDGVVLEIPYVIQDGFQNYGKLFQTQFMLGQLLHENKIVGSYLSRIAPYKFQYYKNNPALAWYGFLSDEKNKNYYKITKPQIKLIDESLEYLGINFVIIDRSLSDFEDINVDFENMKFKKVFENDNGYTFFERGEEEILDEKLSVNSNNVFGYWSNMVGNVRWIADKAGILVKIKNPKDRKLVLKALSKDKNRKVKIFMNNSFLVEIRINDSLKDYELKLSNLKIGLNQILFVVEKEEMKELKPQIAFEKIELK